jgi:hypothetical protein
VQKTAFSTLFVDITSSVRREGGFNKFGCSGFSSHFEIRKKLLKKFASHRGRRAARGNDTKKTGNLARRSATGQTSFRKRPPRSSSTPCGSSGPTLLWQKSNRSRADFSFPLFFWVIKFITIRSQAARRKTCFNFIYRFSFFRSGWFETLFGFFILFLLQFHWSQAISQRGALS